MASSPSTKRPRQEEDDEDLLALLNDDKNHEEVDAEARRRKRRQRWKSHAADDTAQAVEPVVAPEPPPQQQVDEDVPTNELNGDDDDFDMFSSSVSPVIPQESLVKTSTKKDDFDDAEGYYKATIGETVTSAGTEYKVLGIVGKGVFSTVLKAKSSADGDEVALKLIRNNETMEKASFLEMKILRKLQPHPHIVQLLSPSTEKETTYHHNHVVMCFTYMRYNLRDVLQKFGRGVGISIQSIELYFPQLLSALRHFRKHSVLHADLKPDNILVSSDFSTLQVCDFGSATLLEESGMIPTPYLVSRYYRAPEIILGMIPSYEVDLWSAAVSVAELFLGNILFSGNSNNRMLESFMEILGSFPPKQIKHHLLMCKSHPGLPVHFQDAHFLKQDVDKVTGAAISKRVSLQQYPTKPLQTLLLKAKSASDSRIKVLQFSNLLARCLALDPTKRLDLREAMHHEFFQKKDTTNTTNDTT